MLVLIGMLGGPLCKLAMQGGAGLLLNGQLGPETCSTAEEQPLRNGGVVLAVSGAACMLCPAATRF